MKVFPAVLDVLLDTFDGGLNVSSSLRFGLAKLGFQSFTFRDELFDLLLFPFLLFPRGGKLLLNAIGETLRRGHDGAVNENESNEGGNSEFLQEEILAH